MAGFARHPDCRPTIVGAVRYCPTHALSIVEEE